MLLLHRQFVPTGIKITSFVFEILCSQVWLHVKEQLSGRMNKETEGRLHQRYLNCQLVHLRLTLSGD